MDQASKIGHLIRESLRSAAIYGALADADGDEARRASYTRLRELELDLAKRSAELASTEMLRFGTKHFSISIALLKLASKVLDSTRIARLLRRRFQRKLSLNSEQYAQHNLGANAVESMKLLNRLSSHGDGQSEHVESDSHVSRTGTLRAAVLGINDGLVSNTALVLGVAGGSGDPSIVLLAGLAGLVSGSLSMAAGEYVSVVSQREFNENLVRWERAELLLWHDEEKAELVTILAEKGLDQETAQTAADRIMSDPDVALDVHVREELGIDPDDLGGSPIAAMISSFIAFAVGAIVPLVPFILGGEGGATLVATIACSATALIVVGGGLGWASGTGTVYGAVRMALVGFAAGAITFVTGLAVGLQIG